MNLEDLQQHGVSAVALVRQYLVEGRAENSEGSATDRGSSSTDMPVESELEVTAQEEIIRTGA